MFDLNVLAYVLGFASGMLWPAIYAPDSIFMQLPSFVFGILVLPLTMTADALIVALFGTTLGKAIAGIRIEPLEGKRISLGAALKRNAELYVRGLALGVPLVCLYTYTQGYNTVSDRKRPSWDEHTSVRVVSHGSNTFRVALLGALTIVIIGGSAVLNALQTLS